MTKGKKEKFRRKMSGIWSYGVSVTGIKWSQSPFVQINGHQSYEPPWLLILVLAAEIWSQDEDMRDQNFWAFGYNLKLETIVPPGPDWKMNTQPWNVMISQWTPSNKSHWVRHCEDLLWLGIFPHVNLMVDFIAKDQLPWKEILDCFFYWKERWFSI